MPSGGEVHSLIQLYDSEILQCEKVLAELNKSQGKRRDLEDYRKEIIGRFEEVGLVVTVLVYDTTIESVYAFDIQIEGRTGKFDYDPDQMVHEVREDILELLPPSERGQWIKTGSGIEVPPHKH